jgi:hypothetical protein
MHLMLHSLGGLIGGGIAFLVFAPLNSCGPVLAGTSQDALGICGSPTVTGDGWIMMVTVGALIGILVGHVVKETLEKK